MGRFGTKTIQTGLSRSVVTGGGYGMGRDTPVGVVGGTRRSLTLDKGPTVSLVLF